MDLNKLRDQLKNSQPVRVTRSGHLKIDDESGEKGGFGHGGHGDGEHSTASRLKRHTFADSARLTRDHLELARHTRARVTIWEGQPAIEECIETNFGVSFRLVFVVPVSFPVLAPKVYCIEPVVPKTLAYHVYRDGSLCLLQPWEWSPENTLLDVRNWACEWAFNVVPKLVADEPWMSPEHRMGLS